MNPDVLNALVLLIAGSGGTGAIGFLVKYLASKKTGKIEAQEIWVSKMTDQAARDAEKINAAEARADRAETAEDMWRTKFFEKQAEAAYYVACFRLNGIKPPKWPPDDEDHLGGEPV